MLKSLGKVCHQPTTVTATAVNDLVAAYLI